jgi:arylsulfatase A-like enzyme
VSVTAWTGLPPGEKFRNVQTWDMHGNGAGLGSIFGTGHFGLGWALPRVDEAVSALLEDLELRGLLENTLVVMVGEFGRSPKVVNAGRDHWPSCYSAMLAGAGIRGGSVYGASDKHGGYVREKPVGPEDFGATLFHALGVAPETRLGADGFTHPASTGKPILDLFG